MRLEQIAIGPVIRRRRKDVGWNLQQLSDAVSGSVSVGYLSMIETGKSQPSISHAAHIAKALGASLDSMIDEATSDGFSPPVEPVRRVPVVPWEMVGEWTRNPDPMALPAGTPWILAIDNPVHRQFALRVRDEAMQGPTGLAFPIGANIHVDPDREASIGDIVVFEDGRGGDATFKKLVRDGSQQYLRALNHQYPMTAFDESVRVLGVVTGMTLRTGKGVII